MVITGVNTLDGQTLDIQLVGGNQILLEIGPLIDTDPAWASLRGLPLLPRPQTDGNAIYWQNGPRLTFTEILDMLGKNKQAMEHEEML